MNIWVINQFAGTNHSGWGERHFYFSKFWQQHGHQVTIISGSYNHMFNQLPHAPKQFNFENVEGTQFCWIKTPHYNPNSIKRFWSFLLFACKVYFIPIQQANKPDIIIVSSMPIFPILTGYWLKKKYKAKKLLFEIRDIWPLTLQLLGNKSHNHPAVKFIAWFEKFGYQKADTIVSLLPNAKSHFEEIAKAGNKFAYIPNGIDEQVLSNEPIAKEIVSQIPTTKFVIGYTGTIGLANALEYFVEAAILLKNDDRFFFVLVGDGYYKTELQQQAKDLDNILFVSKIKKNQVQNIIQLFDVCFVGRNDTPLYQHGVSANKYFDYMLAAKPVIDSNNLIKAPIELSGGGIIVKPESAQAIVDGILELHSKTIEERNEMGQLGRKYVLENHTIGNLANNYEKLFL